MNLGERSREKERSYGPSRVSTGCNQPPGSPVGPWEGRLHVDSTATRRGATGPATTVERGEVRREVSKGTESKNQTLHTTGNMIT